MNTAIPSSVRLVWSHTLTRHFLQLHDDLQKGSLILLYRTCRLLFSRTYQCSPCSKRDCFPWFIEYSDAAFLAAARRVAHEHPEIPRTATWRARDLFLSLFSPNILSLSKRRWLLPSFLQADVFVPQRLTSPCNCATMICAQRTWSSRTTIDSQASSMFSLVPLNSCLLRNAIPPHLLFVSP